MDIVVGNLKRVQENEHHTVSAQIDLGDTQFEVWYRMPEGPLGDGAETMLVAALLPAMWLGRAVRLEAPISARLLSTLPTVQEIFHAWDPRFKKVAIHAEPAAPPSRPPGTEVGLFFSGGLDSFYSLLKHRDELTQLIFVPSFDLSMNDARFRAKVSGITKKIAGEFRKPVVLVETNLRELFRRYVSWNFGHGAALASVALLLSPQFRKVYISATHSYAGLVPWGSHPLLDPLWGTETTQVVHDGCEATRIEKARQVATCDSALSSLQVCWEHRNGGYNCGQCEKCLRTMVNLRVAGALTRCSAFDRPLDLKALSRIPVRDANIRSFMEENLRAAESLGTDPALVKALRDCLDGRYYRGFWRTARAGRKLARRLLKRW